VDDLPEGAAATAAITAVAPPRCSNPQPNPSPSPNPSPDLNPNFPALTRTLTLTSQP